ncbi:MAG: helix-turn-helix domain-containing protein [Methanomassiliicoccales archaeon]
MDEVLNLENRRRIYQYIKSHPGTYLREMERELGMETGVLSYHLRYMEKRNVIRVEDDGYWKRYFPSDRFHIRDRRTISVLMQPTPRRIVMYLLIHGKSSYNQILQEIGCAKSTLSYHLKRMVNRGILSLEKRDRESWYDIRDADATADLIIAMREGLKCDVVDRFTQIWEELGRVAERSRDG